MVGIKENIDKPSLQTIEITLFGGCGGYGESVLLHLGNNIWGVVDSCVDARGHSLPLMYLDEIGVPIENVRYVICTHWHADHIRGMSELLRRCTPENTTFYTALTMDDTELVAEFIKEGLYGTNQGKEILDTLNTIFDKNITTIHVAKDKLIFKEQGFLCVALSPSDYDVNAFLQRQALNTLIVKKTKKQKQRLQELSKERIEDSENISNDIFSTYVLEELRAPILNKKKTYKKRLKFPKPNCRSVAVLLSIEGQHIVLGADLENNEGNEESGWGAIVRHKGFLNNVQADVYKIPHHGSVTGYMQEFIDDHVKMGCLAKMTTWCLGDKLLPHTDMITKYAEVTDRLYITSPPSKARKIDAPSNSIRSLIAENVEDVFDVPQKIGFIRSRLNMEAEEASREWETKCFGSAYRIKTD